MLSANRIKIISARTMRAFFLMWFNSEGHPIKSRKKRNEVHNEHKSQKIGLYERNSEKNR